MIHSFIGRIMHMQIGAGWSSSSGEFDAGAAMDLVE
jgi:hypothetical protein